MHLISKITLRSLAIVGAFLASACTTAGYNKTVPSVDIERFMGEWYVIVGRFTFLESGAHNAIEKYTYNKKEDRIDISFQFNKDSLDGELKSIPQKGWIKDKKTKAWWLVSPFWPLKFDYLVIGLAEDYSWTAIGVPNQKYLWIMSRNKHMKEETLNKILSQIKQNGYRTEDIVRVPHG